MKNYLERFQVWARSQPCNFQIYCKSLKWKWWPHLALFTNGSKHDTVFTPQLSPDACLQSINNPVVAVKGTQHLLFWWRSVPVSMRIICLSSPAELFSGISVWLSDFWSLAYYSIHPYQKKPTTNLNNKLESCWLTNLNSCKGKLSLILLCD